MLHIKDGLRLEELERIIDKEETEFLRKVGGLGYPTGHELRRISEENKGEWELSENRTYDILNIPFRGAGVLIIERPIADITNQTYRGHKVAYFGRIYPGFEEHLQTFLENLLLVERFDARKDFPIQLYT